jgi:hypothetical protein
MRNGEMVSRTTPVKEVCAAVMGDLVEGQAAAVAVVVVVDPAKTLEAIFKALARAAILSTALAL